MEIDRVKEGEILITEEFRSGQRYFVYGPVIMIDRGTNEVGIKTMEGNRLLPVAKLWTIPAFISDCRSGGQKPTPTNNNVNLLRLLGGYIITLAEGGSSPEILKEVAEAIQRNNISRESTKAQEIIAALR